MHVAKVLPLSDPAPNQGTEPTPYSVHCAPASGRGSCPAFGCREKVWSALYLSEEVTMRIAVFGAGGIGGYLGARLAQAGDEVVLIARGPHLTAIQAHGLFVESPTGDFHMTPSIATDRPEDVGVVDAVLLGVKAWDVRAAAAAIRPMVGATTGVLTLQNGVEAPAEVAEVLGEGHVIVGVAMLRCLIAGPGRLRYVNSRDPNLIMGEIDNRCSELVEHIRAALA